MIRLADYVIQRVYELGVNHIFYVPGGQCVYLTDALRRNSKISPISMHHEQAVAMAALSYSVYTENFGVGLVTTGCAGTNTITGLLHAWQDSIPMLIISGQQNLELTVKYSKLPLRQVGIQEADIETIVKPLTKYAVTLEDPMEIAWHLDKAFHLALTGRKGPVWIDIPLNFQNAMIDETKLKHFEPNICEISPCDSDVEKTVNWINSSTRPIILAGNGIRAANAKKKFVEFVHKYKIPVIFTRPAYDILPSDDPLNMGVIGGVAGASRYANFTIQNSDLVLSIGCRLSVDATGANYAEFAREAKKIVVDIDEIEHQKKGVSIDLFIHSDALVFLERISSHQLNLTSNDWLSKCEHWKKIFAYECNKENVDYIDMKWFTSLLSEQAPANTVYVSDAGFTGVATTAMTNLKNGDRFVVSMAQGEMGYALPGACGLAAASEHFVVSYNGDGSIMMNLQELQTIVRNQFNIKIIIINKNIANFLLNIIFGFNLHIPNTKSKSQFFERW